MPEAYANGLQYSNVAFTCVFAVEAAVKLVGFGFYVSSYRLYCVSRSFE